MLLRKKCCLNVGGHWGYLQVKMFKKIICFPVNREVVSNLYLHVHLHVYELHGANVFMTLLIGLET